MYRSDTSAPTSTFVFEHLRKSILASTRSAITVNLDDGQVEYDVIGKYKRDSNEFVLFVVCDKFSDTYVACLDRALEFAQAWETQDPKGSVYDYDDLEENGEE